MIERDTFHETDCMDDWAAALAPPIRPIVTAALPDRSRSLPLALCRAAASVGGETADTADDRLPPSVPAAVRMLAGYVRIRRSLSADRYGTPDERDAAILASDRCHAGAYETIGAVPGSADRRLDLYRVLTDGSSTIAHRLFDEAAADDLQRFDHGSTEGPRFGPIAELSGIAAALGATAVDASSETRSALRTYGRSVTAAVPSHPDAAIRSTVVRALPDPAGDERPEAASGSDPGAVVDSPDSPIADSALSAVNAESESSVVEHVVRARAAIDDLSLEVGPGDAADGGADPVASLERVTRIVLEAERRTNE